MRTLGSRIKAMSTGGAAILTGGLVSSSIGFLLFLATAKVIETDSNARFHNHARNAQNTISARIKSYTDVLRSSASLFRASNDVTRAVFHDYVAGLELHKHFPAIEVINFAQYVRDEDYPAFDRSMRTEAAAAGRDPGSYKVKPAGRRREYSVIKYVEPGTTWWDTFGIDLQVVPQAAKVILDSRDTGRLITSGRPIAAISGPNRTGLGMRLPLYRGGAPLATVEDRRRAYIGSVGIAFSVYKLVSGVLDEMPIKNVRMTLVDRDNLDNGKPEGNVLFDSTGTNANPSPPLLDQDDKFVITLPIDFNGRKWEATFSTEKRQLYSDFDMYFPWVSMAAGFISALMVYALFHTMSRSRRKAMQLAEAMTRDLRESQAKLQLSHENLRRLAAHADQIKEGERKRIAREIHDDLGQNLLALRIEADMLTSRTGDRHPRLHARALSTLQQIDTTIRSVRQIINDLRPNVLDLGLSAAVEWQIREFERRSGIACELHDDHKEIRLLDDHCATAVFRVLQESLSNISRHAHATFVRVELTMSAGEVTMTVCDNGVGFVRGVRSRIGSFGLVGIEERIHILGGWSAIDSSPGGGTTVTVSVPISSKHPPLTDTPSTSDSADTATALG